MMNMANNNLSDFTDVLNDEIENSQPMSLPSSNDLNSAEEPVYNNSTYKVSRPPKHFGQKGEFRSIEEIDERYRSVFKFSYFNLVQSKVIEDALYSDKSMVVCAPTGSGKTVIFEMAIVQLLMEMDDNTRIDDCANDFKIIYMAPVKALCTERLTEWYPKFTKLGLLCIEVTGDTDVDFLQLKPYRIIITTPEKWDMLTRRWKDYRSLVEVIKLFLIDEVHILNDELRGPVLEAVVSRMKTIESSAQTSHRIEQLQRQYLGSSSSYKDTPAPRIRFVAVSATVSNPEDVATWLGTKDKPAVFYKFGDESRPVKLKRVVEGYPCPEGTSIFKFDIILSYKVWPIIQRYHNGKPTLIFCNTRKSVLLTAETLSREITVGFSAEQKAKLTALASNIKTKKVQQLLVCGVGCHHAGLLWQERHVIEQAFRNRDLPILVTTTTLAMGVNLPAHLVIVKNTQQYVNGAYQEYSISTVLQMVGRAGRPQFDTEATAVIMTRMADKRRYEALVGGSEPLQSYLHKRLAENLNSEAALGTVSDVAQCVQWLNSTFLSVRAARDPKRYLGLPQAAPANLISKKIEELCVIAMNGLATAGLISMDEACCIESTEAGRLMSIYYLDLETMKLIMKIDGSENLEQLLRIVCESHELSDMHLRVDERRCLNALNRNNRAATIRFPMKGKITNRQMKLNCIIQAVLGCLPISDPSLSQEATKIIRTAHRVCKCLVAYITRRNHVNQKPKFFSAVLNSIILTKCLYAHLWENSPYMSKQLKGIGPAYSNLLASAGKVNFTLLEESHPRDLERIINKGPPTGNILRKQISLLPKYYINIIPIDEQTVKIEVKLLNQAQLAENLEQLTAGNSHTSYIVVGDTENNLTYFSCFRDLDLITVYDGCINFDISRNFNYAYKIMVHCLSSNFVGIDTYNEYAFSDLIGLVKPTVISYKQVSPSHPNERKRKNPNEISQSKEKKKRENCLMQKIKCLKESFTRVSKDIKGDLSKSKELSDKLLQNILNKEQLTNDNKDFFAECNNLNDVQDMQGEYSDTLVSEDLTNDDEICSILNVIENEINVQKNKNSTSTTKMDLFENPNYIDEVNKCPSIYKTNKFVKYKKKSNLKNNYNFLDTIENIKYDETDKSDSKQCGLPDTVRLQLNDYLLDTEANIVPSKGIDLLEFETSKTISANPTDKTKQPVYIDESLQDNNVVKIDEMFSSPNVQKIANDINCVTQDDESNEVSNNRINSYGTTAVCTSGNIEISTSKNTENINTLCTINENSFLSTSDVSGSLKDKTAKDIKTLCTFVENSDQDQCPTKVNFRNNLNDNLWQRSGSKLYDHKQNNMEYSKCTENSYDLINSNIETYSKTLDNKSKNIDKLNTYYETNKTKYNQLHCNNIKKFAYSSTQINLISQKTSRHSIQIISKVKLDLDVTKIVHNSAFQNNSPNINFQIKETDNVNKFLLNRNNSGGSNDYNENLGCNIKNNLNVLQFDALQSFDIKPVYEINVENCDIYIDNPKPNKLESIDNKSHKNISNSKDPLNKNLRISHILESTHKFKELIPQNTSNKIEHPNKTIQLLSGTESSDTPIELITHNKYLGEYKEIEQSDTMEFTNKRREIATSNVIEPIEAINPNSSKMEPKERITNHDIINKYKIKMASNFDNDKQNTPNKPSSSEEKHVENSNTPTTNIKSKLKRRKIYRISDLHNIQIALPEYLIDVKQNSNQHNQDIVKSDHFYLDKPTKHNDAYYVNNKNNDSIHQKNTDTNRTIEDIQHNTYILSDLQPPPLFKIPSEPEIDISEAMFNPKTLLKCMNDDETADIIPPPLEFCDNDIYSPVEDSFNENCTFIESISNTPLVENYQDNAIDCIDNYYERNSQQRILDSEPETEIETWTLSQNDKKITMDEISRKIFNLMPNRASIQPHLNPRQAKLSEFKFKNKCKLKL